MNNKILVMGFACLSVVAVAQSNENKQQQPPAQTTTAAPRDSTSGMATGKRMHKPMTVTAEVEAHNPSNAKTPSKTMASDDWQAPAAKSSQPAVKPVSTADGKSNGAASTTSTSDVKNPRDMSTGQSTGKRMHPPTTTTHTNSTDAPKK